MAADTVQHRGFYAAEILFQRIIEPQTGDDIAVTAADALKDLVYFLFFFGKIVALQKQVCHLFIVRIAFTGGGSHHVTAGAVAFNDLCRLSELYGVRKRGTAEFCHFEHSVHL